MVEGDWRIDRHFNDLIHTVQRLWILNDWAIRLSTVVHEGLLCRLRPGPGTEALVGSEEDEEGEEKEKWLRVRNYEMYFWDFGRDSVLY